MTDDPASRTFVFSATLLIPMKTGLVWWLASIDVDAGYTDEEAIDYLHDLLVEDRAIRCTKLVSTADERGRRTVTEKVPTIIGAGAVATITPLHVPLHDPFDGVNYEP